MHSFCLLSHYLSACMSVCLSVYLSVCIICQTAITSLSKLIFFVFQPCLLFVNVASTLGTPGQKLSKLLIVPVFAVLMILVGSVVGRVSFT